MPNWISNMWMVICLVQGFGPAFFVLGGLHLI
jgi:hypothetical protein